MHATYIKGYTAVLGEEQGYLPLPVRYGSIPATDEAAPAIPMMQTEWAFTDDERARIAAGENIILTILGNAQPPVHFHVAHPTCPGNPTPYPLDSL